MTLYITEDELKASLELSGTQYAEPDLARSLEAACRAIDNRCRRRFWLDEADQTITFRPVSGNYVKIDDLADPTSVAWGEDARVEDTDYYFAAAVPTYGELPAGAIRPIDTTFTLTTPLTVVGKFGWPTIPPEIKAATGIIATQLLRRIREAPFGVLATSFDGAAIRIGRNDPQLDMLLGPYTRSSMIE